MELATSERALEKTPSRTSGITAKRLVIGVIIGVTLIAVVTSMTVVAIEMARTLQIVENLQKEEPGNVQKHADMTRAPPTHSATPSIARVSKEDSQKGVIGADLHMSTNRTKRSSRKGTGSQEKPAAVVATALKIQRDTTANSDSQSPAIAITGIRNDDKLQDCMSGSLKRTFPDIDYSMFGYNILLGYPLADGRDPGFTRPLFAFDFSSGGHTADCRYMVPAGLTAAPDVACTTSFTSTVLENTVDMAKSLDVHAKVSGGGWGVSFSASAAYKKTKSEISTGKTKIIESTANCKYYFTKINKLSMPAYSEEMMVWLGRMNKSVGDMGTVDDNLIYEFLDYFGTHFSSEMIYGARYTYENRITSANLKTLSAKDISVEVQASYSGLFSVGGGFGMSDSQRSAAESFQEKTETRTTSVGAPPPYDGDAMTWASTVKDSPVPVQYDLIPIYDLFSTEYTTKPYFTESTRKHIRDRMMSIVSSYCRWLADSGIGAACNDDSVIKFDNLELTLNGYDLELSNKTTGLGDCINKCIKRKGCLIATVYSTNQHCHGLSHNRTSGTVKLQTCKDKAICNTLIIPQQIEFPLVIRGFTYDNSIVRKNKLDIQGSSDYSIIADMCAYSCAVNPFCIGFEMTNQSIFNYNCATYSDYSSNLVPAENYVFEAQLLTDTAKRRFLTQKAAGSPFRFSSGFAALDSNQTFSQSIPECAHDCCTEKCKSNINCQVAVSENGRCKLFHNSLTSEITLKSADRGNSVSFGFGIWTERSQNTGWVNITGLSARFSPSFSRSADSAEICANICSSDVTCTVASWDSDSKDCDIQSPHTWLLAINNLGINRKSKLMFPSGIAKIKSFKLYN